MSHSVTVTWTPSETDITEIRSYTIFRGVDGAEPDAFLECAILRDMFGGIIGIQHCTTTPSIPVDDDKGTVIDKVMVEDAPISYLDTDVQVGHTYCYQVQAFPLGNNQYTGDGPPSPRSNTICVSVQAQATAVVLQGQVIDNAAVLLDWTVSSIEASSIGGYQLWKNVDGGPFTLLTTTAGNILEFEDDAVSIDHVYGYFVVAIPVIGINSPPSNQVFETLRLYRTSAIYPVESIETLTATGGQVLDSPSFSSIEMMSVNGVFVSGALATVLETYSNWPPEAYSIGGFIVSGTLDLGLLTYTNWPAEAMLVGGQITSGSLDLGLLQYTNWPAEAIITGGQIVSGNLA